MSSIQVLLASSDALLATDLKAKLAGHFSVTTVATGSEATLTAGREGIGVIVASRQLADEKGIDLLGRMAMSMPRVARVMILPHDELHLITIAVNQAGLQGVILQPFETGNLVEVIHKAYERSQALFREPLSDGVALNQQLAKANIELASMDKELKATQQQLIISDKMAALGQLVANVSHEINTPVSAIRSSALTMEKLLKPFVEELPGFLLNLPTAESKLFHSLLMMAVENDTTLSTREERVYRKELEEQFHAAGIEDSAELAKALVDMQLVRNLTQYIPLFAGKDSSAVIQILKHLAQLRMSLTNINIAAEKTTKIILALKSYAYVSREEKFEPVSLDQSIQSILTIYHNLLKHGVQVVKDYQEVPPIPAIPDQLGQVWANLIHNAIQAMDGKGSLSLGISLADPYVQVKITDTGPGIPQEIVNRIFEPFFTTKEFGEGSGLGLDICRRIVERHRGRIQVESQPGHTTFTVFLPLHDA